MALRLVEIILPADKREELEKLLKSAPCIDTWIQPISDEQISAKMLLPADQTESLLNSLDKRFSLLEGFRLVLLPVQASIPRPDGEDRAPPHQTDIEGGVRKNERGRMYREEVYSAISDTIRTNRVFVVLVLLSSIVAAVGLWQGNLPVIIGAMVIAPLLGPNVALSFATTLGDTDLSRRALRANIIGIMVAIALPVLVGLVLSTFPEVIEPDLGPDLPEIASRTRVGLADVIIALVAGAAGGFAFTTGISTALVGVIIAVALIPPIASFGLLLGAGYLSSALGSLLLLVTNLICVNLAGVLTFLAQGIQPTTWWEADKAKRATRRAIAFWTMLFVALVLLIIISRGSTIG